MRSRGWNIWLSACIIVFAFCALGMAESVPFLPGQIVLWLVAAGLFVAAIRGIRAGLIADEEGVVVRGFVMTRRFKWDDVADVRAASSGNLTRDGWCVAVALGSGRTILSRGTGTFLRAKAERMADEIVSCRPRAHASAQ